ncbi:hypothetical protein GW764_00280 [Candidatus Parcubacteria bacterium]|nr:hypothetical protein [Candidatus Parcubacteria bacterium]
MKLKPQHYDILGLVVFLFIVGIAFFGIYNELQLPQWVFVVLLLIGVGGLLIDGSIVYNYFIKRDKK